ncbi:hypothetical protein [Virgibacillus sp. SK37]|uniref:hypothetical protein n=1 Tax=Virgibacillus sp. SK37 TaxID=403957 RepID=UPI0004D12325|nr:hypothetical protein [Virgibacillus sp. SK37]AIF45431.1 hypothetical protein X953_10160 [Virgibacillus sp. SK37]
MSNLRIPVGLCDITYDGKTYSNLGSEALFETDKKYKKMNHGQQQIKYMLEEYVVSLTLSLSEENYETLKLADQSLKDYSGGLYDNPSKIDYDGKELIIHPVESGNDKTYDIVIFKAIVDPENPMIRTFSKGADTINIRFLGQPSKQIAGNTFKSYYFIGDPVKAGV